MINKNSTNNIEKAKQEIVNKNYGTAKDLLNQAEENEYGDKNYYLGILYLNDKDYNSAEECFKESIFINDKHIGAYLSISELYNMKGESESAKELLEKAYNHDPDNINIISYLAGVYMYLKDYNNALKHLRNLYDKDPQEGVEKLLLLSLESLSNESLENNNLDQAKQYAQEMIKINEDYNGGYKMMGIVNQKQNDYKSASEYFTKAFQRLPNDVNITNLLTHSLIQVGDYKNAQISNKRALEVDSDNRLAKDFQDKIQNMIEKT